MTDKLWITPQEIKRWSSTLEDSIEDKKLVPEIIRAQNIHVHDILGSDWYDAWNAKIDANTLQWSGITDNEQELYDKYLKYALRAYATMEYFGNNGISASNTGNNRQSSSNATPVETEENKDQYKREKSTGDFYANKAKRFICKKISEEGQEAFPFYDNSDQLSYPNRENSFNHKNFQPIRNNRK